MKPLHRIMASNLMAILMAIGMTGCATGINNIISAKWPDVSPETRRAKSLEVSTNSIDRIDEPDMLVQLSQQDISSYLAPVLTKKIKNANVDNVKSIDISNLEIKLDKQTILIGAKFELHLIKPDFILKGRISGLVAATVQNDALKLYPMVDLIQLEDVDRPEINIKWVDLKTPSVFISKIQAKYGNQLAVNVANAVFDNFMSSINRVAFKNPEEWHFDMSFLEEKSINEIIWLYAVSSGT